MLDTQVLACGNSFASVKGAQTSATRRHADNGRLARADQGADYGRPRAPTATTESGALCRLHSGKQPEERIISSDESARSSDTKEATKKQRDSGASQRNKLEQKMLCLKQSKFKQSNRDNSQERTEAKINCCQMSCCKVAQCKPPVKIIATKTQERPRAIACCRQIGANCRPTSSCLQSALNKQNEHEQKQTREQTNNKCCCFKNFGSSLSSVERAQRLARSAICCAQQQQQAVGESAPRTQSNCAKCQLLARWTMAQTKLVAGEQAAALTSTSSCCSDSDRLQANEEAEISSLTSSEEEKKHTLAGRKQAPRRRRAPEPPVRNQQQQQQQQQEQHYQHRGAGNKLLGELEVSAIELFLKSHKSSVYVCGCMANLYFTSTQLADNGRVSRPESNGWRLNKTGVPALIFDSGLAKNRQRKRLSISLAERGSGFVLWSDTIDHLSNYRAFSSREQLSGEQTESCASSPEAAYDSFHVMYLSSNHRIMVGLSFDDATCARLFLAQIELVCSDPANIALSGPKLKSKGGLKAAQSHCRQPARQRAGARPRLIVGSFLQSFRAAATARRATSARHPQQFAATSNRQTGSSWATLKRAMRLGRGATANKRAHQEEEFELIGRILGQPSARMDDRTSRLVAAFRPRPLAQLAAAGQVWRKSARRTGAACLLPQKCDISAPCLFQHVTSVDSSLLSGLYSKSFVSEAVAPQQPPPPPARVEFFHQPLEHEQTSPPDGQQQQQRQKQHQQAMISTTIGGHHNQTPSSPKQRQTQISVASQLNSSNKSSSLCSSSCYSSASHSPTSSECETAAKQCTVATPIAAHKKNKRTACATTGWRAQRPLIAPPEPPIGRLHQAQAVEQSEMLANEQQATKGLQANFKEQNKIVDIMRELQANKSLQLVDAKRKLMEELIADKVVIAARHKTTSKATMASQQNQQTKRVSRL